MRRLLTNWIPAAALVVGFAGPVGGEAPGLARAAEHETEGVMYRAFYLDPDRYLCVRAVCLPPQTCCYPL
jgi:hypothetical protein